MVWFLFSKRKNKLKQLSFWEDVQCLANFTVSHLPRLHNYSENLKDLQCIHLFFWLKFPLSARRQRGRAMCLVRLSSLSIASGCVLDGLSMALKIPFNSQPAAIFPNIPAVPGLMLLPFQRSWKTHRAEVGEILNVLPPRALPTWQLKAGVCQPFFKLPWSLAVCGVYADCGWTWGVCPPHDLSPSSWRNQNG